MPKKIAYQKENTGLGKLAAFSGLVLGTSQILRNHVNEKQLAEWLEEVASEKLGPLVDEARGPATFVTRESLCRQWVAKVGRGHMVRKGECDKASLSTQEVTEGPEWLRRAASCGAGFTRLLMTKNEREELCSILDWLRSDQGPSLASDWSKVSWPQALESEKLWIEEMGKAAAKKDMEAADALGTEFFCEATGPNGAQGWRWVKVKSPDSLDREGLLMKHCVGSYAKDVAAGRMEIYSLRDGFNKPLLTVEKKGVELSQLKAFANQACPEELRGCVGEFLSVFTKNLVGGVGPELSRDFGAAGYEVVPGLGVIDQKAGLSKDQEAVFSFWTKDAESGGKDAIRKLGQVFPFFASIGCVEAVKVCLELGETTSVERTGGLEKVCQNGHLEIVKLLLSVSDPKENGSWALAEACGKGHVEIVNLLLPVSDPKAGDSRPLLRACNKGHLEMVKLLLPVSDPKAADSRALACASENGHLEMVKLLLPVSDPKANDSQALAWACQSGHLEVVKLLLHVSDPKAGDSWAFRQACENGHLEIVKLLLPVSDPKGNDSQALLRACEYGHLEVAKLLLPVSDPKAGDSRALAEACNNGHLEAVKLLLPVSDPKAGESRALRLACHNGHLEVVKLLLLASDPKDIARAKTLVGGKDRGAILELLAARKNNGINETELCEKDSFFDKLFGRRARLKPACAPPSSQAP